MNGPQVLQREAFGNTDHLPLFWVKTESASLEMLISYFPCSYSCTFQCCSHRKMYFYGPETIFHLESLLNKSLQIEKTYLL